MASLAYELAAEPASDETLACALATDVERVRALAGGRPRCFAPDGVGPADLAAVAAKRALELADIGPADVDFIIFSTNTPDYTFPGSACLLQAAIDAPTVGCLDIRAVCSGFVVALDLARRYVGLGTYRRVLVAAAEVPSHQNRFDGIEPELAVRTADAAAVALVDAGDAPRRVLSCRARTDGRRYELLWCEFPASRYIGKGGVARGERLTRQAIEEGKIYPRADFKALRSAALAELPPLVDEALAEAGLERADVLIVAHVDPATERELAERLAERARRVALPSYAYCYSASLPLALAQAVDEGRVEAGETVVLATAGGGASWGAAVVRV